MHYKNGREAKNGDKVVLLPDGYKSTDSAGNTRVINNAPAVGVLYDAQAGNDHCNGKLAPISNADLCPNLAECLHLDDVLAALPKTVPDTSKKG